MGIHASRYHPLASLPDIADIVRIFQSQAAYANRRTNVKYSDKWMPQVFGSPSIEKTIYLRWTWFCKRYLMEYFWKLCYLFEFSISVLKTPLMSQQCGKKGLLVILTFSYVEQGSTNTWAKTGGKTKISPSQSLYLHAQFNWQKTNRKSHAIPWLNPTSHTLIVYVIEIIYSFFKHVCNTTFHLTQNILHNR